MFLYAIHSPSSMKREKKLFLYSILISLLLTVIVIGFMLWTVSLQEQKFNTKLNLIIKDYDGKIDELNGVLNDEMNLLQNLISNVDKQTKERDQELLDLITKVESESKKSIEEAKSDLERELSMIEVSGTDFSGVIQDSIKSVVSVLTDKGQGSGAIISERGDIVTNFHVIQSARVIKVLDYDKVIHNVDLIGVDSDLDIAVLRIVTNETFDALDFGDSDDVKIGQIVVALGNPLGLDFTATQGIISARRTTSDGNEYIQIDVPINPGNSGGPIIDAAGDIIGIANWKISGAEGVGFAIPSNIAEEVVSNII